MLEGMLKSKVISPSLSPAYWPSPPSRKEIIDVGLPACDFEGSRLRHQCDKRKAPYCFVRPVPLLSALQLTQGGSAAHSYNLVAQYFHPGPGSKKGHPRCNLFSTGINCSRIGSLALTYFRPWNSRLWSGSWVSQFSGAKLHIVSCIK